jgi:hypothetical protein
MPNAATLPTIACPNCRQAMQTQDLEKIDHGTVQVELCFGCAGIWFDHLASLQLAPAAVIELFKEIHEHPDAGRQTAASHLKCPRCSDELALSFDLCKSGRFSYYRCLRGDGRFTPFFQFLREKQFVRSLTAAELERIRSQVRQVTCSQCGAPIDLEHESQCRYCHAPVSLLDPEAVEKAMRMWSDAENRRHLAPTPEALQDALLRVQHTQQSASAGGLLGSRIMMAGIGTRGGAGGLGQDLVSLGIYAIGRLFQKTD